MTAATTPAFVIHSLKHLRAVLAACGNRPVIVLSGAGAGAYAGPSWFMAMIAHGFAEFPEARMTAILDCGDRAADAFAALNSGAKHVIFTGHPDAAERLRGIAAQVDASILAERPAAFDLLNVGDPDRAVRRYFAGTPH
jgi:hypothetical protein